MAAPVRTLRPRAVAVPRETSLGEMTLEKIQKAFTVLYYSNLKKNSH